MERYDREDTETELKELITKLFRTFHEHYGYKRITKDLKKFGHCTKCIMKELGLKCVKFMRKSRKYNSYNGRVGKVAKNRLSRRFSTSIPLQKLVTDITEFKCLGEEKLYLNPILDLYNGEIITYDIKKGPTLNFVMPPLIELIGILKSRVAYCTGSTPIKAGITNTISK